MAFTILADGIPKYYYGQEQHLQGNYSPYNRQALWENNPSTTSNLYTLTTTLNTIRNRAISIDSNYITNTSTLLHTDASTYAARKGPNGVQIVSILSNQGSKGGGYTLTIDNVADPGTNMTEVVTCTSYIATGNGTVFVEMDKGEPRVLFPSFQLNDTGICGFGAKATGTGGKNPTTTGSSPSSTHSKKGAAGKVGVSGWVLGAMGLMGLWFL